MRKFYLFACLVLVLKLILNAQIPSSYYDAAQNKIKAELKTALHQIIKTGHQTNQYSELWQHFTRTDKHSSGNVWDIYSNCNFKFVTDQCGNYKKECDCYNREHVVPVSWIGGNILPMYGDLHHILPVDGWVNSFRSNYPIASVGKASQTSTNGSKLGNCNLTQYSGIVFEPIDEYKGDMARIFMYMATRYEDLIPKWSKNTQYASAIFDGTTFPGFTNWSIELYLEWHEMDPPSQKEISRNDSIYAIQKNRNPFIDYPEMARQIWSVSATTQNFKLDSRINIYPNPATDFVYLASDTPLKSICIYQINGQKISCKEVEENKVHLETINLVKGLYFIECFDKNNQVIWSKLIKD